MDEICIDGLHRYGDDSGGAFQKKGDLGAGVGDVVGPCQWHLRQRRSQQRPQDRGGSDDACAGNAGRAADAGTASTSSARAA